MKRKAKPVQPARERPTNAGYVPHLPVDYDVPLDLTIEHAARVLGVNVWRD